MTFIKRLMEIKEEQLILEQRATYNMECQTVALRQILKVLERRKNGKRKISRKN